MKMCPNLARLKAQLSKSINFVFPLMLNDELAKSFSSFGVFFKQLPWLYLV